MDTARIGSLLAPFLRYPLAPVHLDRILTYIDLLLRWNARTNLTSIRNPEEIVTRHIGESLFAAQALFPSRVAADALLCPGLEGTSDDRPEFHREGAGAQLTLDVGTPQTPLPLHAPGTLDLLDLGSGAGFPGIPIQIWAPHLRTTLIESQQKKVAFLREVIRALTLTGIDVFPARAETFPGTARQVTLRAVERFDEILPAAAQLLAPSGRFALLIGAQQEATARDLLPSLTWLPLIPIPLSTSRVLLLSDAH
jgi:16S rRNA (guanine527-N7)-methyltransferase